MSDSYEITRQNEVRQVREKAAYEKEAVHSVLDAGLIAHVAFIQDDQPVVVPMLYGHDGETVYLHGARKARIIKLLDKTDKASLNVTLVDALVLARSAFHSSMNYRSATLFGKPRLVDDRDGKLNAMRIISEHLMPGRWDELRDPTEKEIKMTGVIALDIDSASAKISAKAAPEDEPEDYDIPIWAGLLPLISQYQQLVDADRLIDDVGPSDAIKALEGRVL